VTLLVWTARKKDGSKMLLSRTVKKWIWKQRDSQWDCVDENARETGRKRKRNRKGVKRKKKRKRKGVKRKRKRKRKSATEENTDKQTSDR
jgi:hypothetical protein